MLFVQSVFVVRALDDEARGARREPGDSMLTVACVIDRGRATRGGEEAQLVERDSVDGGKEDLAKRAVHDRVPKLALGTWRGTECHLATGTPHRGCSWASWC